MADYDLIIRGGKVHDGGGGGGGGAPFEADVAIKDGIIVALGEEATIVSGVATYRNGRSTGALPGRLVRGGQQAPQLFNAPILEPA